MSLPHLAVAALATLALAATVLPAAVLPDLALAQSPGLPVAAPPAEAVLAERAARRFPQPVRVGDLPGRKLLGPGESQPVLGRVAGIVRGADGRLSVVVHLAGWFGTRSVAVPVEAVGLLGEHVALLDLAPEQLTALPSFEAAGASEISPDQTIRVGLVKPFH